MADTPLFPPTPEGGAVPPPVRQDRKFAAFLDSLRPSTSKPLSNEEVGGASSLFSPPSPPAFSPSEPEAAASISPHVTQPAERDVTFAEPAASLEQEQRGSSPRPSGAVASVALEMPPGTPSLEELMNSVVERSASDLHLSTGLAPYYRIHGNMVRSDFPVLDHQQILSILAPTMPPGVLDSFLSAGDADYSNEIRGLSRIRANCFMQHRGMAAVLRVIPHVIPRLDDLGLPKVVSTIARLRRGLVLVTGATGSGKSTTLAAVLDRINETRRGHIITIEDPLEFIHRTRQCQITHREVGRDAASFSEALRAALREDPDVVLVGEMRDLETVDLAANAAETGLLVLGTLHTNNASRAVDRLIDIFPSDRQAQMRVVLADCLKAVVAQRLLRRQDGKGRVGAYEVLVATPGLANMIREGKTHQIPSVIQTGKDMGMQTMESSLQDLLRRQLITRQDAAEYGG